MAIEYVCLLVMAYAYLGNCSRRMREQDWMSDRFITPRQVVLRIMQEVALTLLLAAPAALLVLLIALRLVTHG